MAPTPSTTPPPDSDNPNVEIADALGQVAAQHVRDEVIARAKAEAFGLAAAVERPGADPRTSGGRS